MLKLIFLNFLNIFLNDILRVNRLNAKYCVFHNGYDNLEFFTWCIKSQRIIFGVQEQSTKFLSRKILVNIDAEGHYYYFFF